MWRRYFTPKKDGAWTALWFYVVPLDEHSTRVVNHAVIVQKLPAAVKKLAAARPRWIDHLLLNEIFDGAQQGRVCCACDSSCATMHGRPCMCCSGAAFLLRCGADCMTVKCRRVLTVHLPGAR